MDSLSDISFSDISDPDEDKYNDTVMKELIISFNNEDENISISSFKLANFYFKPLQNNINTLIFCAFFANHFEYFYSFSYSLSFIKTSDFYDEKSIEDQENFSLKNPNFQSFSPVLYYKNECLLDINNLFQLVSALAPDESYQKKLIEKEIDTDNGILMINALIELIEFAGSQYYHEITLVKTEKEIIDTIQDDYNSNFVPCFYIFQIDTDIPYRVMVEFNINNDLKKKFNFRIVWGILEDKLIYIDDDEICYEFNLITKSFISHGKNQKTNFENLIFACYSLECE